MGAAPLRHVGPVRFDWDEGNAEKSWEKHDVRRSECEEVFAERPLLVLEDVVHSQAEPRHLALGRTRSGRRLFVAFTLRETSVRVISARDMSRKERRIYDRAIEEQQAQSASEVP